DLDLHTVAQLELSGNDDCGISIQSGEDLNPAVPALAKCHPGFDRLAVLDDVDERFTAARNDGAFRHQDYFACLPAFDRNACEQPRPQQQVGVLHARSDVQCAAIHIEHGADGIDLGWERPIRDGIDLHQNTLSGRDLREGRFRQLEVQLQDVDLFQIDDRGADADVGSDGGIPE